MDLEIHVFKAMLTGRPPGLLLHNGQLANPRNPFAMALAAVSKGKAKDLDKTARNEFMGSLYLCGKGEPCIPVDNVLAVLIAGARGFKIGKQAAAGIFDADGHQTFPLIYDGPRSPSDLYESPQHVDSRGVRVQMSRIQRTRPIFPEWKLKIQLEFDPSLISREEILRSLERAGKTVGLGDYRPRFGRFIVEAEE